MTAHQFQVSDIHVGLELPGGWVVVDQGYRHHHLSQQTWRIRHQETGVLRSLVAHKIRSLMLGRGQPPAANKTHRLGSVTAGYRYGSFVLKSRVGYDTKTRKTDWVCMCVTCGGEATYSISDLRNNLAVCQCTVDGQIIVWYPGTAEVYAATASIDSFPSSGRRWVRRPKEYRGAEFGSWLMSTALGMIIRDGCDPRAVHKALACFPDYLLSVPEDMARADFE